MLGDQERVGHLLVYQPSPPPRCPTVSLLELSDAVSDVMLESRKWLALGDFNVHAEALCDRLPQASMAFGTTQIISGPIHQWGHTLDLEFCPDQGIKELKVGNMYITPFS